MAEGHYTGVEAKPKAANREGETLPGGKSTPPPVSRETKSNRQPVDISEFPVAPLTTGTGKVAEPDSKRAGPSPNKPERQRVDTKKIIKSLQQQLDELAEREKERKRQKADKMARYRERRRLRETQPSE